MQCHDVDVPVIRYNFVKLSGLADLQKEAICGMLLAFYRILFVTHPWIADVIVIVKEVGDLAEITTRNNKTVRPSSNGVMVTSSQMLGLQTQKRDLVVVDNTEFSVRLTLWGKQAEQFGPPLDSIIAFKGVKVSDFNGKWLFEFATLSNVLFARGVFVPSQFWIVNYWPRYSRSARFERVVYGWGLPNIFQVA